MKEQILLHSGLTWERNTMDENTRILKEKMIEGIARKKYHNMQEDNRKRLLAYVEALKQLESLEEIN